MNKLKQVLIGAVLALMTSVAFAQSPPAGTQVGITTLAAAITSTSQTSVQLTTLSITVGQYTTVTAANPQWGLEIDGEIMRVTSIQAGTTVSVSRGMAGTKAGRHGSGAVVWAAPLDKLPSVGPVFSNLPVQKVAYSTVPIGSVGYSSFGTESSVTAGTIYYGSLTVSNGFVATGCAVLIGTTGTTDLGLCALYNAAGNLVASSAVAGATVGTASTIQKRVFSPGPAWIPPGNYFLAYQQSGTHATLATVAASTFIDVVGGSQAGTFGVLPSLTTVPITLTADKSPIGFVY